MRCFDCAYLVFLKMDNGDDNGIVSTARTRW